MGYTHLIDVLSNEFPLCCGSLNLVPMFAIAIRFISGRHSCNKVYNMGNDFCVNLSFILNFAYNTILSSVLHSS